MKKIIKFLKDQSKRLTFFDYLIFGVLIVGVIVLANILLRKSSYITVTVKASEDNVAWTNDTKTWFSQLFHEGMMERDGVGRNQAEVVKIYSYDTDPSKKALYLTLKLKAVYSKSTGQYSFKGKPLLIGNTIKLFLDNVNLEGLIVNIENLPDPREKVKLRLETRLIGDSRFQETEGSPQYVTDAVKVGDKVYDSQGNTILTVISKYTEPAKRVVTTSDGRVLVRTSPLLKDAYFAADVNAMKIGGKYYLFDDVPISIGFGLPINLPFISIFPTITKISIIQ